MTVESILQCNTRGVSSAKQDLLKLIKEYQPSVISIQETFLGNDAMIKLPGYLGISKQGHFNQRFHGGVAIYIHSSCPHETININSEHQIIAARITLLQNITLTVTSIYLPGRSNITEQSISDIISQLPTPFILLGDFNGHSELWGFPTSDARGRRIRKILADNHLNCLNDGTPTHESGSAIDLTICSPALTPLLEWTVLPSVLSSDHHPILTSITSNNNYPDTPERYNYKKANWDNYSADAAWSNIPEPNSFTTCAELLGDFYNSCLLYTSPSPRDKRQSRMPSSA